MGIVARQEKFLFSNKKQKYGKKWQQGCELRRKEVHALINNAELIHDSTPLRTIFTFLSI